MSSNLAFKKTYNSMPEVTSFTPGRVNLIGEHIDYNGGMVLPAALEKGIFISLTPRNDNNIRIYSDQFDEIIELNINNTATSKWSDYALGSIVYANKVGFLNGGADIAITTTLPLGAGLSSSSALIVGILKLTASLSKKTFDNISIAILAKRVENEFIGMPCGIMDQMAISCTDPGKAIALDTKNLSFEVISLPKYHHMAIIHSGEYRLNTDGNFKKRKEECDIIKEIIGHNDICSMSDNEFILLKNISTDLNQRARHCVSEHQRTLRAIKAIKEGNIPKFGLLMTESHNSMRDDFKMSLPSIDNLVNDAIHLGAVGARLTGGGFGGCIVACILEENLEAWRQKLLSLHPKAFNVI
ncbi:MAG: galactokinase [Hellea sp.]|nr:galactokinase [Hellea sp.]